MAKKSQAGQRTATKIYFKSQEIDYWLQIILGYQAYHGSSLGEILYALGRINEKKLETWIDAWQELALLTEEKAKVYEKNGDLLTASDSYLRASTYYRAATFATSVSDKKDRFLLGKISEAFQNSIRIAEEKITPVEIDYEEGPLSGYFFKTNLKEIAPTLITIGGGETYPEDFYYFGGLAGIQRGYNVLSVDLPGQGHTFYKGMLYRHDVEVPFKNIIDYLEKRKDVDKRKIGAYGVSLGGYFILRGAAYDKRISACVASSPIPDWYQLSSDAMPPIMKNAKIGTSLSKIAKFLDPLYAITIEKFGSRVGTTIIPEAMEKFKKWNVDLSMIKCPCLCVIGLGEDKAFEKHALKAFETLEGEKELLRLDSATGADAHCQVGNLRLFSNLMYDWLDKIF